MTSLYSYPSIHHIDHRFVFDVFDGIVNIEEKIDGSQFGFTNIDNKLQCRSKGQLLDFDNPQKMFIQSLQTVEKLQSQLNPNYIYRAEYLSKPKHNALKYDRIPKDYLIIFDVVDISKGIENYLDYENKKLEAQRLGLECVPLLYSGVCDIFNRDNILELLQNMIKDTTSILGGCKIEGVVIKNYNKLSIEKKIMIAKLVSEDFKEKHQKNWKMTNPQSKDIIAGLIETYKNENRWKKSIQHLKEQDQLTNTPKDIGLLIQEIHNDVLKEEEENIKDVLFKHFWPKIRGSIVKGFPEWYKNKDQL